MRSPTGHCSKASSRSSSSHLSTTTPRIAAVEVLKTFDMKFVTELSGIHRRLDVPVKLIWGDQDPFFPVERARAMVSQFPDASIDVIEGVGLFSHEEAPAEVAEALLPTLTGAGNPQG